MIFAYHLFFIMKISSTFLVGLALILSLLSFGVSIFGYVNTKKAITDLPQPQTSVQVVQDSKSPDGVTVDLYGSKMKLQDGIQQLIHKADSSQERVESTQEQVSLLSYRLGFDNFQMSCKNMTTVSAKDLISKVYYSDLEKAVKSIVIPTASQLAVKQHFFFPWQSHDQETHLRILSACADTQNVYLFGAAIGMSGNSLGFIQFNPNTKEFHSTTTEMAAFFPETIEKNGDVIQVTSQVLCSGQGDFYIPCDAESPTSASGDKLLRYNIKTRTLTLE